MLLSATAHQDSILKQSDDYGLSIRAHVRGLWGGQVDLYQFIEGMIATVTRGFTRAWYDGARAVGIQPSELTLEELSRLQTEINGEISHIYEFGLDIERNNRAAGKHLGPLLRRAEMWTARYEGIKSLAMMLAGGDRKMKWVWNPLKEHCSSCQRLNGRVYRSSTWRRYNIYPRSRELACRGYRCGCVFVETTEPATPGRPPSL
jgi:hypothetical protein